MTTDKTKCIKSNIPVVRKSASKSKNAYSKIKL